MAGKEKTILQLDGEINLKADKAKQSMQELKKLLDEFKGKTIDIKAQTRSARMSIQNLGDFISRTFNRENTVKLATADAQAKIDRLATTLKSFKDNTKITLSLDARGVSSQLQSIRNDLNFITGKHTISINASTQQVKSQLTSLVKDINNIKNVSFTVNVKNNADIKGINTFTKDMSKLAGLQKDITFGITVKSVQNSLDRVRQVSNVLANLKNNNSIQFTESGLNPILGKLKNMELYLRSIKQNSKIKISAEGAKDLPKLKVEADQSDLFAVEKRLAIITNQIRRINRMTLKVNTRYNNRSGGGRSGGSGSGGQPYGDRWYNNSFYTQFVHFVGRSSKGLGSFGEALSDVLAKAQASGGALGRLAGTASVVTAGFAGLAIVVQAIASTFNILVGIGKAIGVALKPGYELMAQRDTTMLTTKAALKTSASVDGRAVTNEEAVSESTFLFNRAMQEAAKTVLNLNDILTAQQGVLPMLLNKGMTPKQAQDVIFGVAGVAKTGRLAPNQVLQETRDLAQGSITARTSQVANILGITNQDLAKFKGDVDALYEYLMQKFQEYTKVMEEYANTPVGAIEQLQETWGIAAMTIVDQYGPLIVEVAQSITKSLGSFDEQGNFHLSDWLKELADGLQDIVVFAASAADSLFVMIKQIVGGNDPVEVFINFIIWLIDCCASLTGVILGVIQILKGLWVIFKSGVSFVEAATKAVIGFGQACFAAFAAMSGNPAKALGWIDEAKKSFSEAGQAVMNGIDIEGQWKGTIQTGWTASGNKDGYRLFNGMSGPITELVKRKFEDAKNRDIPKGRDVQGMRGNAQNKEDEKARKKAIKDAQKAMKEHIQGLKEQLKDHIAELKETLAKNKIAFDEGFMTIKDYYTQKAQIEAEEAQARLEEAQAEKAAILATPYENQADQLKALHTVNREIREYTRAVEKTTRAQKEIADFIKKSADTWADIKLSSDTMFNSNNAVKPINVPLTAENTSGMSNTEILYRLFTTTGGMNDAMARGIIASLMGESTRDLLTNVVGDKGTSYGIAQWHEDRWWTGLEGFASKNNSEISHILTQGNYLLNELWTTERGAWAEVLKYWTEHGQTAEAMTYAFTKYFERPADKEGQGIARQKNLAYVASDLQKAKERPSQVQTIPSQYNKYGIDTRYTDIENTLRPNEIASDLGNLQQYVKDLHNLIAREYSEATGGKKLSINIATAGSHPSNSSPWGHKYGYKIDYDHTGVDYDVLARIFNKYGVAGVIEGGNHIDASFGKGYVGEGRLLTNSETGTEAFNRYSKGNLASTQLTQAMTTEASHELQNMVKDAQKRLREAIVENESFLFDQYSRQLDALVAQMNEEIAGKNVQMLEPAERDSMIQQIKVKYQRKMTDLIVSATEKTIDYNLNKIEDDFKLMLTEVKVGRLPISAIGGRINNVINYFWNINGDNGGVENGVWGIFTYLERLMSQAQEYLKAGNMQAYQQTMNKVITLKDKSFEVVNSWVDGINKIFDHAQDLFDTSDKFTNLQREFGDRELKAIQAQQLYSIYSDHEAELRRLRDSAKAVYDTALNTGKINEAKEAYRDLVNIESQLWDTTAAKEKMRLVAEQYPNYLHDLRKTAKQALEDGLVTFLTDGVNEAENLGEALRNLAISFLKEIQQMSAKWMVKSLMNQWFGGWNVDDPNSLSLDTTGQKVAAGITGAGQAIIDALNGVALGIGGSRANTAGVTVGTTYSGTALPALTTPVMGQAKTTYQLPPLANSQFGIGNQSVTFGGQSLGVDAIDQFNQKLQQTSDISLSGFSNSLEQSTTAATDIAQKLTSTVADTNAPQAQQAMQNLSVSAQTASAEIQSIGSTLTTGLQTAFMELEIQAKAAAQALSNIAFRLGGYAEGGYISGPGTSTSDSIPAMLSNSEYVIRASSVKKYGRNFMDSVNNGTFSMIRPKVRHYAQGGLVSDLAQEQTARGISNFGKDISNNISNTANISVALVRDEQEGMKQLLRSPEGQRIMLDFSRKYASVTSRF